MPQHVRVLLSLPAVLKEVWFILNRTTSAPCENLPPAALPQRWTGVLPVHFLFYERETEKKKTR